MSDQEITKILQLIDEALVVFEKHQGSISSKQISVKSMLQVLRLQLHNELQRIRDLT